LDQPLTREPFRPVRNNTGKTVRLSQLYGPTVGRGRIADGTPTVVLYQGGGRFALAQAGGPSIILTPRVCLNRDQTDGTIPLTAGLPPGRYLVRADGTAAARAAVRVTLDGEPGGLLSFGGGQTHSNTWVDGSGETLRVRLEGGSEACVAVVTVGPARIERELAP
jgi:hypothetical protein